jgi:hypothetical protein
MSLVDWMDDIKDCVSYLRRLNLCEEYVALAMDGVLTVAKEHHISLDDIHNCIFTAKNPKWEASLEKLKSTI